jgi:hypothetical protein
LQRGKPSGLLPSGVGKSRDSERENFWFLPQDRQHLVSASVEIPGRPGGSSGRDSTTPTVMQLQFRETTFSSRRPRILLRLQDESIGGRFDPMGRSKQWKGACRPGLRAWSIPPVLPNTDRPLPLPTRVAISTGRMTSGGLGHAGAPDSLPRAAF